MSETVSAESIGRRLDGLQNNVSGLNRRMITLESNLIDRVGALEARMAGLEDRADQLVDRIGALATGVNSLVLLVERIAKAQGLVTESNAQVLGAIGNVPRRTAHLALGATRFHLAGYRLTQVPIPPR